MKTYRPRLRKKAITFKRTDGSKVECIELVCSNCGMKQTDSEYWPAKEHLKKCKEFKAPYVWTETHRVGHGTEDYMGNVDMFDYSLCCNGRALWCSSSPDDKKTFKALNDHQISPYQYNRTDWRAVCFPKDYITEKKSHLIHLSMEKKTFLADHAEEVRKIRRDIKRAQTGL
jgi:hypothetical protein